MQKNHNINDKCSFSHSSARIETIQNITILVTNVPSVNRRQNLAAYMLKLYEVNTVHLNGYEIVQTVNCRQNFIAKM